MKKLIYLILCITSLQASAQYANGKIKIYFNRPVDNALASNYPAVFLNGTLSDTLAAYINRAKYTIDVAQYDYLSYAVVANIATAINNAYARGVVVRWIYDGSSPNTALSSLNSGIHTLGSPTTSSYGIMHDKFVVIDANSSNTNDAVVWTGSADWSKEQIDSDFNNIIIFQDKPLAQAYTAQFNQMWGGTGASPVSANEKFGPNKTDLGPHIFTIGGTTVELYFSPKDSTNDHILDAINSANSQLFFGVYTFTESNDANAIVTRKNAGVVTAGIIDQYSNGYSAATILNSGLGTKLKTYTQNSSIYHNKYLIVDPCNPTSDPLVLTGSHNWTVSADTKNDENTVIIHNADIANIYYHAFYQDFSSMGGSFTACTVPNPCANAITLSVTLNNNVLCYNQSNGKATAHAHGTHGPFTFSWNTSPTHQTDSILNASAGTYTVTVTDANLCTATASVTITQPNVLSASVTTTSLTCHGSGNGTATAAVTGGTGVYHYAWNTQPQQTTATAGNLPAGAITVTVTDGNSCTATGTATVSQPQAVTVTGTITNVACLNGNTGSVNTTVSGGTSGYQYLWSTTPQQTTANATGLTANHYTVTVTDAHNCTATAVFNVTQPGSGITLSTSTTNAGCGTSTGTATVTATNSPSPVYHWSNGGTTATISNVGAGSYTVTVTASGGCTASASALVNSSGGPALTASSANTSCGNNNGTASVTVSGGTQPYTYIWSNNATTASLTNLTAGTYNVTVHDNGNCNSIASVVVAASNSLVLNTSTTATSCSSDNGTATVTVNNATNPAYIWSNGGTTGTVSNLAAGTYTVTVTDSGNCSATASATVAAGTGITNFNITVDKNYVCHGDSAYLCAVSGYTNYSWSNGQTSDCIYVRQTGTYAVTATDNGSCSATSTPATITVYPAYQVNFGTNGNTLISTAAVTYQWLLNGTAITGANAETWDATQSGNYAVEVTDSNGCTTVSGQRFITIAGLDEINAATSVKIYPNPLSGGNWQLEVSDNWIGSMAEMYDATGKLVYKSEIRNPKSEINISLPQGIYLVRISLNGQSVIRKLIKL